MAYIYKITNLINGKSYIGKTLSTIDERWKEHCRDAYKERCEKRPLYSAINKYGIENFKVEQIEECDDNIVNEREVYWIEHFGTFKNGYNATIGGDGKHYLDYDLICETYKQVKNMTKTAELCNCHSDSVKKILKERKIDIISNSDVIRMYQAKMINQYDLNGEYIRTFASLTGAAKYIQSLSPEKRTNISGISHHISDVAKGKRKTAYKFIWKFAE